jgi:tRNA(Ile)-lysidine synthase
VPFEVARVDVRGDGTGPENAARTARLAALTARANARAAAAVLTGHTADDNAETMLLNIARGTGLAGLAGIPAWRRLDEGLLLGRPVLQLRRDEVRAAAAAAGLPVVVDPTNTDPQQRRARARSGLLPLLQSLTGADTDPVAALQRLARHARSDTAALDSLAQAHGTRLVQTWGSLALVDAAALRALPAAIAGRIVRDLLSGSGAGESAVTAVLELSEGRVASLPGGLRASRGGGWLAIGPDTPPLPERALTGSAVALPELGLELRLGGEAAPAVPPWAPAHAATSVAVDSAASVVIRSRRPGDRITTAAGTQSVADANINAGVPRLARDLVPVVADARGPLWVPGVAVRAQLRGDLRLRFVSAQGQ